MSFPTLKGEPKNVEWYFGYCRTINITKWEGQQMVNFELRKHLWGVADIGVIVETRTQIYSRDCLSFFVFPCFLALGNKQTNKTTF